MSTNGIAAQVQQLQPRCYLISEAAKKCGRSVDTLRRWHKTGRIEPSLFYDFGKTRVWLYSESDITKLKKMAEVTRPGRKKKDASTNK